jgi:hypothetical protein
MTTSAELEGWAGEGACVMHLPTGTIGIAVHYHDGDESQYRGSDGDVVPGPILEVGQHTFIARDPTAFVRLSPLVAECYVAFAHGLGELMRSAMMAAARRGVAPEGAVMCFSAVLREQLARLSVPVAPDTDPDELDHA